MMNEQSPAHTLLAGWPQSTMTPPFLWLFASPKRRRQTVDERLRVRDRPSLRDELKGAYMLYYQPYQPESLVARRVLVAVMTLIVLAAAMASMSSGTGTENKDVIGLANVSYRALDFREPGVGG